MKHEQRLKRLEQASSKDTYNGVCILTIQDEIENDTGTIHINKGKFQGAYNFETKNGETIFPGISGDLVKYLQNEYNKPSTKIVIEPAEKTYL